MKQWKKAIALLLAMSMCVSMLSIGSYAANETDSGAEQTVDPGAGMDQGGGEGGGSGSSGSAASFTNRWTAQSSVYVMDDGETAASFTIYGYYESNDDLDTLIAFAEDASATVYADSDATTLATGVTATLDGTSLTLDFGSEPQTNQVYFVAITTGNVTTTASPLYVVAASSAQYLVEGYTYEFSNDGDEDTNDSFTLYVAEGYTADPANENAVLAGGSQTVFSAADFSDIDQDDEELVAAVNWYLTSGATNGGDSLTEFAVDRTVDYKHDGTALNNVGKSFLRTETVQVLYRLYMTDSELADASGAFTDVMDLANNVWNNYYITSFQGINPLMKTGFYQGDSVCDPDEAFTDSVSSSTIFGVNQAINYGDFLNYIYNVIINELANLSESGEALKTAFLAESHATRAERAAAVNKVLELGLDLDSLMEEYVDKYTAVKILYHLAGTNDNMVYPSDSSIYGYDITYSEEDGRTTYATGFYADSYNIVNGTVYNFASTLLGDYDSIVSVSGSVLTIDGSDYDSAMFASGDGTDGAGGYQYSGLWIQDGETVLKNVSILSQASTNNEKYRWGGGSGLLVTGVNTILRSITTDGSFVIQANDATTMSGATYSGVGAITYYQNANIWNSSQHTSNSCFAGTLIYDGSTIMGGGRILSTDHMGGYVIFNESVADKSAGGMYVLDETSSLIGINSYFTGSGSANEVNGVGEVYYVNCLVDNYGSVSFANKTSLTTDYGTWTLTNTIVNMTGSTIASADRGGHGIITLSDNSAIVATEGGQLFNLNGYNMYCGPILVINIDETSTITSNGSAFVGTDAILYINNANTSLTFTLTVDMTATGSYTQSMMGVSESYVSDGNICYNGVMTGLDENGSLYNADLAVVNGTTVVYTLSDGSTITYTNVTLTEESDEIAPSPDNVGDTAAVVIIGNERITAQEYTTGIELAADITSSSFAGTLVANCYYATGILISNSTYSISNSTLTLGTDEEDNSYIEEGYGIEAGSAIAIRDGSTVTIENSTIVADGAWGNMDYVRAGVVIGWQSQSTGDVVVIRNTSISNNGNDENTSNVGYFPGMPIMNIMQLLTVSGQGRAFVALGDSVSYLYNDTITGTGWAAICTDMATDDGLYVYSVGTVGITYVGGYGVYSDTNCYDYFYNSTLQGADFGCIISNDGALYMTTLAAEADELQTAALAYATEEDIATASEKESVIAGGRNAIMSHATSAGYIGSIDLSNTTIYTSEDIIGTTESESYLADYVTFMQFCDGADILLKTSSLDVSLVNVTASSYTNTLILAVVDTDNGGITDEEAANADSVRTSNDIYLENVTTTDDAMNIYNYDFQRVMNVEIANMVLTGAVDYYTYEEYMEVEYLGAAQTLTGTEDHGGLTMTIDADASWIVTETSYLTGLTIAEGASISAPDGYTLTMTVDGVQTAIAAGSYEGEIVLTVTVTYQISGPNMGQLEVLDVRAAAFYNNGELDLTRSICAAIVEKLGTSYITSEDNDFNGIFITADEGNEAVVSLSNYVIDFTGYGTNDMGGFGAAVYVAGYGIAEISNFKIITDGATRGAVYVSEHGTATISNSSIYTISTSLPSFVTDDLNNMEVPWMLGLTGNCRSTNAVDDATVTYADSIVIAMNWGALSTDNKAVGAVSGTINLNVYDTYAAVLTSGYGTYADGSAEDDFVGVALDVPDMAAVITGSGFIKLTNSIVNAGSYAVMSHSGSSGTIALVNSEIHVGETAVLVKDAANKVDIINTSISFDGTVAIDEALAASYGVDLEEVYATFDMDYVNSFAHVDYLTEGATTILKVQHNADAGAGSEGSVSDDGVSTSTTVVATIADSTLTGDIINSAATVGSASTTMMGNTVVVQRPARSLDVTLDNTSITGAITLAEDTWSVATLTTMSGTEGALNYVSSMDYGFYTDGEHGLIVSLLNCSTWTVTETSYLTSLTISADSSIVAPAGYSVTMTVNGVETAIAAGSYEGEIVLTVTADGIDFAQLAVDTFSDVTKTSAWYAKYVGAAFYAGYFTGYDDGTFGVARNLTREEAVVIIVRAFVGEENLVSYNGEFSDVEASSVYADYIATAVKYGIVDGYTDGTFGMKKNITRAEFTKLVVCAAGLTIDQSATTDFTDVADSAWYTPYIAAAAASGLVSGMGDGTFAPNDNITREQAATILVNHAGILG